MEKPKRKRGRPRKNPLPEEILNLIDEVKNYQSQQPNNDDVSLEVTDIIEKPKIEEWDVPKDMPIEYFDTNLSYEITGYKPITKDRGLDFNPDWFTEARQTFLRTGHYTEYRMGLKAYSDFWDELYRRCRNGMTVNGYRITGDNYFFLNFFLLMDLDIEGKAGSGRNYIFPAFYAGQYEVFHYIELCRTLRQSACIMKAREIGYSEILSAITVNSYNSISNTVNIVTAFLADHLNNTLSKAWNCMSFLNDHTDGGFFKLRLVLDKQDHKKASVYKIVDGLKVETGWLSLIVGIVADKPNKIRGYRADLLVFEEAGSFKNLAKEYIKSIALTGTWGLRLVGGTSGDTKEALDGLKKMFYDPQAYNILPHRHSYTQVGDEILSAFFVPCTKIPKDRKRFLSHRGFVDEDEVKKWQEEQRAKMINSPEALMDYCAEFPFTHEEAFSAGNINKFNKILITELLTKIRALKQCPPIERGIVEYIYKNGTHAPENITGFNWINHSNSKLLILEHPIWYLPEKRDKKGNVIWAPPSEKLDKLYVIGVDGIDIGSTQTSKATKDPSDFCCVVLRRALGMRGQQVVAIYKDRPGDPREAYKITLKLALYYNATINIEATRMSFFSWAKQNKQTKWFMKRPKATLAEQYRNTNTQFGTPATAAIIAHQTDLIADFVNDYCDEIWFDEMLDELNNYTDEQKRKFDIVAALGMALLADEEYMGIVPKSLEVKKELWRDIGYYYDEDGIKRYGVIPILTKSTIQITIGGKEYDDYLAIRGSDPRYNS